MERNLSDSTLFSGPQFATVGASLGSSRHFGSFKSLADICKRGAMVRRDWFALARAVVSPPRLRAFPLAFDAGDARQKRGGMASPDRIRHRHSGDAV